MKNYDEITKGFSGFVNLWDTMANEVIFYEFIQRNKPLSYYWKALRSTMSLDILVSKTLHSGFLPSSMFGLDVEDEFMDDAIVCVNMLKMPHLWDVDAIIQPHHFMLYVMYLLDTLL